MKKIIAILAFLALISPAIASAAPFIVDQGGTGVQSLPAGQLLVGNGKSPVTGTSSPTVTSINTSSTTATSTFNGNAYVKGNLRVDGNFYAPVSLVSSGNATINGILTVTGVSRFADGAVGTPSVSFTSDTNTGIYSGGADILRLVTGGADRLTINASGNVGIGTSTPNAKLQVQQSTSFVEPTLGAASGGLFLAGQGGAYGMYAGVSGTGNTWLQAMRNDSATAYALELNPSGGNVGIGTSNPAAQLDVFKANDSSNTIVGQFIRGYGSGSSILRVGMDAGNTYADLEINSGGNSPFRYGTYADLNLVNNRAGAINLVNNGSIKMTVASGGNVGIGTTSPGQKLSVAGDILGNVYIGSNFVATSSTATSTFLGGATFATGGGNVGIGTLNPIYKFDVRGAITLATTYSGTPPALGTAAVSNEILGIDGNTTADAGFLRLAAGGGTNVTQKAAIDILGYSATNANSNQIRFITSGSQVAVIDRSGNVGIGTTIPSSKLEIYGGSGNATTTIQSANGGMSVLDLVENNGTQIAPWYGGRLKYNGAVDYFQIGTVANNVETMAITIPRGSGNVGIGTTTPATNLTVSKQTSGSIDDILSIDSYGNAAAGRGGSILFNTPKSLTDTSAIAGGRIAIVSEGATPGTTYMALSTGIAGTLSERLRINSVGNVGIGTTSPAARLTVTGGTTQSSATGNTANTMESQDSLGTAIYTITAAGGSEQLGILNTPFGGLGSYQNLANYSEQIDQWSTYSSAPTITPNTSDFLAPDGTQTAEKVVTSGAANSGVMNLGSTLTTGQPYTASIWLKGAVGGEQLLFGIDDSDQTTISLTKTWKRYVYTVASRSSSHTERVMQLNDNTGASHTIYMWGGQTENALTQGVYVKTLATPISVSSKGLIVGGTGNSIFSGNVGIGTTSPIGMLSVVGAATFGSNSDTVIGSSNLTSSQRGNFYYNGGNGRYNIVAASNISLGLGSNATIDRLVIDTGGNVGIGTTSPGYKLNVTNSNYQALELWTSGSNSDVSIAANPTNTGFFNLNSRGGTGGFQFTTGTASGDGSPLMTILGNGNVGIGTTSPYGNLAIQGNADGTGKPIITMNGSSGDPSNYWLGIVPFSRRSNAIDYDFVGQSFADGKKTIMTLQTNGNVGVGTTSPAALFSVGASGASSGGFYINSSANVGIGISNPGSKLDVNGTAHIFGTTTVGLDQSFGIITGPANSGAIRISSNSGSAVDRNLQFGHVDNNGGWTSAMTVADGGNVGIGTTSPGARLDVYNSSTGAQINLDSNSTQGTRLRFLNGPVAYNWQVASQQNVSNAFEITPSTVAGGQTFSTPAVTVLSSGNVGIGTTGPNVQTEIYGTSPILRLTQTTGGNSDIQFGGYAGNYFYGTVRGIYGGSAGSTWGHLAFLTKSSAGGALTEQMRITSEGNVGIGTTSPDTLLTLKGSSSNGQLRIYDSSYPYPQSATFSFSGVGDNSLNIKTDYSAGTNNVIAFSPGGTERVRFQQNGNVGIGSTTPSAILSVTSSAAYPTAYFKNTNGSAGQESAVMGESVNSGNAAGAIGYLGGYDSANGIWYGVKGSSGITGGGNAAVLATASGGAYAGMFLGGNVGIGTTSPGTKLEVDSTNGNSANFIDNTSTNAINVYATNSKVLTMGVVDAGANSYGNLQTSGGNFYNLVLNRYGGNVGIGTTTPQYKADVNGGLLVEGNTYPSYGNGLELQFDTGVSYVQSYNRTAATYNPLYLRGSKAIFDQGNVGIGTTSPSTLFAVGASGASGGGFYVNSNTNVGIGTSNPTQALTVNGQASVSSNLFVSGGISNYNGVYYSSSDPVFQTYNGSGIVERIRIASVSGNVGIGSTTPWALLSVNPNGVTGPAFAIGSSTATNLIVDNTGNVGVNTLIPVAKFHVVGADTTATSQFIGPFGTVTSYAIGNTLHSTTFVTTSSSNTESNFDYMYVNPSGSAGALINNRHSLSIIPIANSNTFSSSVTGSHNQVRNFGTGFTGSLNGVIGDASNNGAGSTVASVVGLSSIAGTLTVGTNPYATTTDVKGVSVNVVNSSNKSLQTNQYGVNISMSNSGTVTNRYGLYISSSGTVTNTPYDIYAGDAGAYNYFAGNLGIGTTTPGNALSVNGDSGILIARASNTDQTLSLTGGNGSGTATVGASYQLNLSSNNASYPITFAIGGNEKARVSSTGLLGIGESNPSYSLDVIGDQRDAVARFRGVGPRIDIVALGATNSAGINLTPSLNTLPSTFYPGFIGTTNAAPFEVFASSTAALFVYPISSSQANVGVGTSTPIAARLGVAGSGTGSSITFQTTDSNNSPKFSILDNGNVGIGTTSPYAKLSIVGGNGSISSPIFAIATSTTATPFFKIASSTGFNIVGGAITPTHAGSLSTGTGGALLASPRSVFVAGNYAYVTSDGSSALEIVDVSNPSSPVHKGSITDGTGGALLSSPFSVFVSGNYAYVASFGSGALEIIDVSNPAKPVHKGSLTDGTGGALLSSPYSVYVSGNYAYVASNASNALEIVDVSNPASPVHKGSLSNGTGGALLSAPSSVYVSGNYAYVVSYNSNALEIVDVSNPASPVHKGSLTDGTGGAALTNPRGVFISGNYAYIANDGGSLEIVDISNPTSPTHKGVLYDGVGGASLKNARSLFVSGNYAYVTSYSNNTLEIVDVSNPANPVHNSVIGNGNGGALLSAARYVVVSGNYAYVASYSSNALEIVDIGGGNISNIQIGSAKIDTLQVQNFAQFNQGINVHDAINVGGNARVDGQLTVGGSFGTTTPNIATTSAAFWGKVGIGTSSPAASLVVVGSVCISVGKGATVACGTTPGNFYYTAAAAGNYDVAENYLTSDSSVGAGDIVMLDPNATTTIMKASQGFNVFGVISTAPGMILGGADATTFNSSWIRPVALSGRVPVKVNGQTGDIAVGDKITLSSTPGVGRKAVGSEESVGIALEPFTGTALDQGIINVFISSKSNVTKDQFAVDGSGNIGIGTSTPEYKLQVNGDIAATAFVNISSRLAKKDISYLDDTTKMSMLDKLKAVGVATYRYNTETENAPLRMGLIAEEAPSEVLADSGKGVDVYKLSTFILAGVQEMAKKLDDLNTQVAANTSDIDLIKSDLASTKAQLAALQSQMTSSTGTSVATGTASTTAWSSDIASQIVAFFTSIGLKMENGIAYITNAVVDNLSAKIAYVQNATIDSASVNALTIGSAEKRSGITLYDQLTGEPYCLKIVGGQTQTSSGACPQMASSTPPVTAPAPGVSGSLVSPVGETSDTPQAVQPSSINNGTTTVSTEPMTESVDTATSTNSTVTTDSTTTISDITVASSSPDTASSTTP